MADWQRSEPLGVHLAQPTRLEARRHQREVTAGEDLSRLGIREADLDGDRLRSPGLRLEQRFLELRLALARDNDLTARIDDRLGAFDDQVDALLMDQAGHKREQGASGDCKPELIPDIVGVQSAFGPVPGAEGLQ